MYDAASQSTMKFIVYRNVRPMYATSYPKRGRYDAEGTKKRCLWTGPYRWVPRYPTIVPPNRTPKIPAGLRVRTPVYRWRKRKPTILQEQNNIPGR